MTSANTIPSGLTLYWFTYALPLAWHPARCECEGRETMFLENDDEARRYAKEHHAIKAERAITGEIIFPNTEVGGGYWKEDSK